ncbi:DUF1028 domain-containing protein, partial [Aureisphaera galaxeae]|uniref:DUF1028 domain-containing protein n=1 Tax=Aureisphaera galaxeae TaxID=1538023 RepID=UPI0023501AA6
MKKNIRPQAKIFGFITIVTFALVLWAHFLDKKTEQEILIDSNIADNSEEAETQEIDTSRDHEGDTFSIVAFDPTNGVVGGAGCSCVGFNGGIDFLNDLILDSGGNILGGINSQASYSASTQAVARTRMEAGDTPQEIIDFVVAADAGSANRQYGVVGFDGGTLTTAGWSGGSNGHFSNHIGGIEPGTGIGYSIQGNILDNDNSSDNVNGQDLLDDMEAAFLAANGTLADKLMAAMQGAKRVAGDVRCDGSTNSGRTAFVRVLTLGDADNAPSFSLNTDAIQGQPTTSGVPNFTEPIDKLQAMYDDAVGTGFCYETVNTFPYSMDFETTMWLKDDLDTDPEDNDRSWMRDRSQTPSGSTGPNSANQGTFFAYLEASNVTGASDDAAIASPCFEIPAGSTAEITFDYHMYGANIGTLALQANTNDGSGWVTLWDRTGQQNTATNWFNNEAVSLSAYAGSTVKLRFRASRSGGFTGDSAIDDINITVVTPTCAGATKTWDGTNWSPPGAPIVNNSVVLTGNYDTSINGNISACQLTINSGVTLTIPANTYTSISGNITVDGTLVVEHRGSVVQTDDSAVTTNNGTINVNLTTPNL